MPDADSSPATPGASDVRSATTELELRRRELELREREVAAREREVTAKERTTRWVALPALAVIVGALLTVLAAVTSTWVGGRQNRRLEEQRFTFELQLEEKRFESGLILEAARTGSKAQAAEFLRFFVDAGFLDEERAAALLEEPWRLPVFANPVAIVQEGAPLIRLEVSGTEMSAAFWVRDGGSGAVTLPDGPSIRIRAEVIDAQARRVRVSARPLGSEAPFVAGTVAEGESLELRGPPPMGRLEVEVLAVVLAGDALPIPSAGGVP